MLLTTIILHCCFENWILYVPDPEDPYSILVETARGISYFCLSLSSITYIFLIF